MEAHATATLKIAPADMYFSEVGVERGVALSANSDNGIEGWWKPPGEQNITQSILLVSRNKEVLIC